MPFNQTTILKMIDAVCGRLLMSLVPPPKPPQTTGCGKVLIIRPGGIGDAALLVPVINNLKSCYPQAQVDILAERRNAAVFKLTDQVDNVFLYDRGELGTVLRRSYDVVIDSEQWHRLSAVVARLVKSPVKIGFATNERSRLFTHAVNYNHQDYEIDSFCNLLAPLGITFKGESIKRPFLVVPDSEFQNVKESLATLQGRNYVVIFPGASVPEKRWPIARFRELVGRLNGQGYPVVIIGGPDEHSVGETIVAGMDGINLAGRTSLPGSAAIIGQALLLVSGDSGMLHVAVGLNRSTVALFGPGPVVKWGPRGEQHTVINKGVSCSPCARYGSMPSCPHQVKCLQDIGVEDVYAAVMNAIRKS